jgi:hypothetical protein
MADVFISYAREDRPTVEMLAVALKKSGYTAWWDGHMEPDEQRPADPAAEFDAARAVCVLWSKHSVVSPRVNAEADLARQRGRLTPVALEGVAPPADFASLHPIDFTRWRNGEGEPFHYLLSRLAKLTPPSLALGPQEPEKARGPGAWVRLAAIAGIGVLALAGAAVLYVQYGPKPGETVVSQQTP